MTKPVLIEAAIDSFDSAERAVREGARRLEVCSDLDVGGLTPSLELLGQCLDLDVPCMAMARPRSGDFAYGDAEFARLCADAATLLAAGADGIVFGCLRLDQAIDEDDVRELVAIAGDAETVFHRAFDKTPDAKEALATLIDCEVTRVLTSGHADTATTGATELMGLVRQAKGRITVLPGGTVRGDNVVALVNRTGASEVHARATERGVIAEIRAALDR